MWIQVKGHTSFESLNDISDQRLLAFAKLQWSKAGLQDFVSRQISRRYGRLFFV